MKKIKVGKKKEGYKDRKERKDAMRICKEKN